MAFPILGTPKPAFFDSSGSPLASGTLTIVEPSTDVNKATYPTYDDAEALTNANANPLTLDARGEPASGLWGLDGEDYKITLKDSDGNTIWTVDDIFTSNQVFRITSAEVTAGVTITDMQYPPGDIRRYGAVGDDATDNATAIQAAIDVAEVSGGEVYIPEGIFRFATGLTNTATVSIRGAGATSWASTKGAILKKVGNIAGLTVTGNPGSAFSDFTIDATGDTTGIGLHLSSGGRSRIHRMVIRNQGSHGLKIGNGNNTDENSLSTIDSFTAVSNGGDGILVDGGAGAPNCNAITFNQLDLRANTGWGLNLDNSWSNFGNVTAQANTGGGVRLNNSRRNIMTLYTENNTGDEVELASTTTYGNILWLMATASTGVVDNTTLAVDANFLITTKHQAELEPKFRNISVDTLSMTSQKFDGTTATGRFDLTHSAASEYTLDFSGTTTAQNFKITNSGRAGTDGANLLVEGKLGSSLATANTNTPSGATAYAMPIYDHTGALLGYIPVYGSVW